MIINYFQRGLKIAVILFLTSLIVSCDSEDINNPQLHIEKTPNETNVISNRDTDRSKETSVDTPSSELIETSKCHIKKKYEVHFSSEENKDQVRLEVEGAPCAQGAFTISVYSKSNSIFSHEGKASDLLVDPLGITIGMFSESLDTGIIVEETSHSWPEYVNKLNEDKYDETYVYSVSQEEYLDFQKRNLSALSIAEHFEFTSHVVYDPVAGKAIMVWGSGL